MKGVTALQRPVTRSWVSKPLPLIPLASAPRSHQLALLRKLAATIWPGGCTFFLVGYPKVG